MCVCVHVHVCECVGVCVYVMCVYSAIVGVRVHVSFQVDSRAFSSSFW